MHKPAWRLIGVALSLTILAAACAGTSGDEASGDADEEATGGEAADGGEPVKVGGTLGLTGSLAGPSEGYRAAYRYWADQVNANGGLLGRQVELIIYDDESTPATAQSLYQRLINEDAVDLLLAPYSTFVGGAILPLVDQNEMVLWNGGFVGIELFKNSEWIVGSYTYQDPDYSRGIFEMIDSLPEDQRPQRVGIATGQNPFPIVVRDGYEGEGGVLNYAEERGMDIVVNEEYATDATDVSGIIQRAKSADVDLFFALSLPNDAALLARTAQDLGFEPDIYCSCGSQVTSLPYWSDLAAAGDGIMAGTMAWPTDDYPGLAELTEFVRSELGYEELPAYVPVAYGILQVMQQAVEGAGTLDQAGLRDYATGRTFETANGPMEYDQDRIPAYNAVVVQYRDDHNEVVWPPERATAEPRIPMNEG
ncbi:MAG: amino acid ABC transporter substrate-binding protein [Egibacteraceae bacterium]